MLKCSLGVLNVCVLAALSLFFSADTRAAENAEERPAEFTEAEKIEFYRGHVKPILREHCFKCHGGEEKLRGGLRLTRRENLLAGGDSGSAVDLDTPADSLLLSAVNYDSYEMPPKGKLPADKIAVLTKWVKLGVPYAPDEVKAIEEEPEDGPPSLAAARTWWAYQPLVRPEVPRVQRKVWVRNPIDAFILARLEEAGLEPAPPASRTALLRRAYYDLIGLPPTPQEVDAFLADDSPDAYAKVIDRLLKMPQYGEKWGRHWLDLVRYADSHGYERDADKPNAWRYRDYVIRSFNSDKPYDRFIIEQLAGNHIPGASKETRDAALFEKLGIWDDEPVDPVQAYYDGLDDVVNTTAQVFLGVTIGCARCHDHKIDPVPQTDYYRMMAFFHTREPDLSKNREFRLIADRQNKNDGNAYVLIRGNAHSKGQRVDPGYPLIVSEDKAADLGGGHKRLALARWIADAGNPLTTRVVMNRLWQYHFGRGIVDSPNDFGRAGAQPTHPLLLDWLATELPQRSWRLKEMHRLIMLSSAYRMSSRGEKQALAKDPTNRLFWRFNMRRLTAEELRDSMLAVSGTLNKKMYGPPIYYPLAKAVLATASRPHKAWGKSPPEEAARRTVYVKVRRSLRPPLLSNFDAADTDSTCPVRFVTTVPTQALGMLNSGYVNQQAQRLAERLLRENPDKLHGQVRAAIRLTTGRLPQDGEVADDVQFIRDLMSSEKLPAEKALSHYCLMLLNTNEFVYLD